MKPLRYRLSIEDIDWLWEVLTEDGRVIATGAAETDVKAKSDAMLEALRLDGAMQPH